MQTGKQLQKSFEKIGINALWISGRGMIFMSNCYGVRISVSGKYSLFSRDVAADVLEKITAARAAGDNDPIDFWLHGRETARMYQVK